jgi:AmmeMemoRadiSam system protein B
MIVFFLAGVFFCYSIVRKIKKNPIEFSDGATRFHSSFYVDKQFYGDLDKIVPANVSEEKIYGGIVSHHLLVAKEIAQFFSAFKKQSPKTIVIIGPNHFNVGKRDILLSKYPYKTPWGVVESEEKYINELLNTGTVFNEEDPFSSEHSISSLVSFVKYFLPDAKIIPIIVKRSTTKEKAELLAKNLDQILPEDAVVIASVDFSHHLNKTAANFHDKKSISAIKDFNYEGIFNSEIDSPSSIYALLKYLELREAKKIIYKNTNSADFMGKENFGDVTSYFFAHFIRGGQRKDRKVSVLNFGDMMFSRDVEKSMENGVNPFEKIKGPEGNFLKGVDFISANLEGPITEKSNCLEKAYSFKFDPTVTGLIAKNGINIVNLANNHTGDCKAEGLKDTEDYLLKEGIDFFGSFYANRKYIEKEINGRKIVFIGIDTTVHSGDLTQDYELIRELKEHNDFVVVNIHWGYEYHENQSEIQEGVAHSLVDSGVDVIIGHHPHVIQPMEIYKNKAIFYSLGNFIFDQVGKETNKGLGVGVVFSGEKTEFYLFPYDIKKYQPTLLVPEQASVFCDSYLSVVPNKKGCYFETKVDQ